ncbi:MAG TPA: DNA polymerase III subunit psi [Cyclobacteriaceae bacterium]|nr:DNA polymerase III subunit psi [Cyclobacteriaceae bacterium]
MIDQATAYTEEIYKVKEKTTIILSVSWADLPEADQQLLQKILQSVKLKLASVRVVYQPVLDLGSLRPQPSRMIYFGEPVAGLGQFECITTEGTIVLSPPLSVLQNDPAGKQKLWVALKQLFGL